MPRLRPRGALALLLVQALACQPVPTTAGNGAATAPASPFRAAVPDGADGLVFPPPRQASARRDLPRGMAKAESSAQMPTTVEWPELDSGGHFAISGQTLRLHFNREMEPGTSLDELLTLDPPVDGKVSWSNPWVLSFHATAPFDPDTEYTATLGEVNDTHGKRAAEGWTGIFTAEPRVAIGGKIISYLPEAGKPKTVVMRPDSPHRVSRTIAPTILFDQPVTLTQVAKRIEAKIDGTPVSVTLAHADKDAFEGAKVDRHHMVTARPERQPGPGQTVEFAVLDDAGAVEDHRSYEVAEALRFNEVECSSYYYDDDECTWKDGALRLEGGNRFSVRFNNTINASDKALAKLVKVTPRVENLQFHSDRWREDGAVWISGEFRSSTTYSVKVGRIRDRYGSRLPRPVRFDVEVAPLTASVSMPEGQQVLDEAASRRFSISTRNVERARLELWEVEPRAEAWAEARRHLGGREKPANSPDLVVPITPKARRDVAVKTTIDLLDYVAPGKTYLARLQLDTTAFAAAPPSYPEWAMAARPPTALLTPHDDKALAVHVHAGRDQTLVHVAKLASGAPVAGAQLLIDGTRVPGVRTGADGMAVIDGPLRDGDHGSQHVIEVQSDYACAVLAMRSGELDESDLAPELAGGQAPLDDIRAMVFSDRGVYRPGAKVELKGTVQFRRDGQLRAASAMPVGIRIESPTGQSVFSDNGLTGTVGSIVAQFSVPADAEVGRYRVMLVAPLREDAVLATYGLQVAEFEPPRFTVDVETETADDGASLRARVHGRYLFGANMEDAPVSWTLRRKPAPFASGPLTSKGFSFRLQRSWWDDEDEDTDWMRTGEGKLDPQGRLVVTPAVELQPDQGPQRFVLEAEVTDESHRAIAGRSSVVMHPAPRYAGLKLTEHWLDVGTAVPVEAGVIDNEGGVVTGVPVELRLEHLEWKRVRRPGPGGFADVQWREVTKEVARCTTAGTSTTGCRLVPAKSGSYRVSAWVDGRRGGSLRAWAWGRDGGTVAPSPGRRVEIIADRDSYRPGQIAQLSVRNPFPAATAILTVEQGGILHHETRAVTESAVKFAVPMTAEHAPYAHATITLLPRGAKGEARVDWKIGAVRLPVPLTDSRLDVVVASDSDRYAPGDAVDIVVDVSHGGKAVEGAEVALAVVDEGVLRLTNYHAPDPLPALYPGQGLTMWVDDNRRLLAEQLRRSHVAGDGTGAGSHSLVSTRKNFVRTALWKPELHTDADGRVHARFTLPDNLTRFRMMAVVVDAHGRGGVHEDDFEVQKPLMIIPAVPRFAAIGDDFEAAVLVHNNQGHAETTTVTMGAKSQTVELPAGGRARVAFDQSPKMAGPLVLEFAVADAAGVVRDRVQSTIPVQAPGTDERPSLHGSFRGRQQITLEVPAEVFSDLTGDDHVTVTVGENLWPELGSRLEYLIGYPHGCVEQTTSSTLPLLAARDILPRLGVTRFGDDELRKMIKAGVDRLATMRTGGGGLAYWPGGHDPNPFGTAYATLALARAQKLGIAVPEGMLEDIERYMTRMLERDQLPGGYGDEVRASLALALAELEALPLERVDGLWDTASDQGTFGTATLAMALASLPGQDDRVQQLVDTLEGSFDSSGTLTVERKDDDFWYYGSDRRTIAQSALALHRLRPSSSVLPLLVGQLVRETGGYTTQSTAYALLALAERIRDQEGTAARQRALLDGVEIAPDLSDALALGPSARRYRIPLARLRGHTVKLTLESESDQALAFMVSSRWRRVSGEDEGHAETTTDTGPDLYRVITDVKGHAVDLSAIEPGQVLRVVLLARMPQSLEYERRGYLAVTDRLPAGFEAMQPDLWTVAEVPQIDEEHPLYQQLRWTSSAASHVELRDDRAQFYFDRVWGEWVHATYLMRATTPGHFNAPPAVAELMYEPNSAGYSRARSFTVVP